MTPRSFNRYDWWDTFGVKSDETASGSLSPYQLSANMLVNASHLTASPFNTFAYADLGRAVTGFFRLTHLNGLAGPGGEWVPDCNGDCGPIFELHPVYPKKMGEGDFALRAKEEASGKPSPKKPPKPLPVPEEKGCPEGKFTVTLGQFAGSGECACEVECCWDTKPQGFWDWFMGRKPRRALLRDKSTVVCRKLTKQPGETTLKEVKGDLERGFLVSGSLSATCGESADGQAILREANNACLGGAPGAAKEPIYCEDCCRLIAPAGIGYAYQTCYQFCLDCVHGEEEQPLPGESCCTSGMIWGFCCLAVERGGMVLEIIQRFCDLIPPPLRPEWCGMEEATEQVREAIRRWCQARGVNFQKCGR